ncbi:MAG: hypothetical protein AAGA18_14640 [Verrucomicrobiota bacterium]
MEEIENAIRANPQDMKQWQKLERMIHSSNYWDVYYGYTGFRTLAQEKLSKYYPNYIAVFKKGLNHRDMGVQVVCVEGISNLGPEAIHQLYPDLEAMLSERKENSLTWEVASILGQINNKEIANDSLKLLLKISSSKPTYISSTTDAILRKEALKSAYKIAQRNLTSEVIDQFETSLMKMKVENESDQRFKKDFEETIHKLQEELKSRTEN